MDKTLSLLYCERDFVKWEQSWITWLLGDMQHEFVFDPDHLLERPNPLLILSGDLMHKGPQIASHIAALRRKQCKVGVLHLSDEWGTTPISFYKEVDFVFRNYWRPGTLGGHVRFFGIGYKAGFADAVDVKPIRSRKYQWTFVGHIKGIRVAMMEVARQIPGGNSYLTHTWDDPKAMSVTEYAGAMSDTVFALCPVGNSSPDSFRLYEALEAGAIPIVEDYGGRGAWGDILRPRHVLAIRPWTKRRWRTWVRKAMRASYWEQAYGEDFPCPRIWNWAMLPRLLKQLDVEHTSVQLREWWAERKQLWRREFRDVLSETYCIPAQLP